MFKCLFGHTFYELSFIEEAPNWRLKNSSRKVMLEKALAYSECTKCGKIEISKATMDELNRRQRR